MAVKIAKEKKSKEVKPTQDKVAVLKPISKKKVADEEDDFDEEEEYNSEEDFEWSLDQVDEFRDDKRVWPQPV